MIRGNYVKRFSKNRKTGGWNQVYISLNDDTSVDLSQRSVVFVSIYMKDVYDLIAWGQKTDEIPGRPEIPVDASIDCLMAIPKKPSRKAKIYWILFPRKELLQEYVELMERYISIVSRTEDNDPPPDVLPIRSTTPPPPDSPPQRDSPSPPESPLQLQTPPPSYNSLPSYFPPPPYVLPPEGSRN